MEQQLVLDGEREKGGRKEKTTRGERLREERKGHLQTLTMGVDDKRMRVFVYNASAEGNESRVGCAFRSACCLLVTYRITQV